MTSKHSEFTKEEAKYGPGFQGEIVILEKRTSLHDENGNLISTATVIPVHTCVVCGALARPIKDGLSQKWECVIGHVERCVKTPITSTEYADGWREFHDYPPSLAPND